MKKGYFNKFFLAALAVMALAAVGCKKYLDQKPITSVGVDVVYSDVSSAFKGLAAAYSRLSGDQGYGIRVSLYYTVDNDEMQGPTSTNDDDRRGIARYTATPANAQITSPFNQMFQGIEYSNIVIDNIPKMVLYTSGSDQQKKQLQRMVGEAMTLRAQFYFEAIRNWGDLPAHFAPAYASASENPFPKRTDRDSLYDKLIADLKIAEDMVPWRNDLATIGDQPDERITKGTIKALRARLALFRGGYALRMTNGMQRGSNFQAYYQIAKDECNDIIASVQHELNPSFKALWRDQVGSHVVSDPQGELMFQVSAIGSSGQEDTKLGYYNGPTVNGFGNKSINVMPNYFYLFDSTDQRRDVTCCAYNVNADGKQKTGQTITAINDGKYRRDWITNPAISPTDAIQYFGLKWQIIRYSDVLLMLAEADNELNNGPTAAAYNAVNMVRRRGFGKSITAVDATVDLPAGLSKAAFFNYIVRERSLELGGEGVRKFDLIRWNLLNTAIAETKANLLKMSNSQAMSAPSYMAPPPAYALTTALPTSMYYKTNSTADDVTAWANSFYTTAPTATPAGTTKITWVGTAVNGTALARFAVGFITGKSELLPIPQPVRDANFNFTQNPGY